MTLVSMVPDMSPRTPPVRTWASTSTPEAEAEITAAVRRLIEAEAHVENDRRDRDDVIRKHHAAGVDPRDLARIAQNAGWRNARANYFPRITGKRTETGTETVAEDNPGA